MSLPYIQFFNSDRIDVLFQNINAIMFIVMPILLISVALFAAEHLITVVRSVFSRDDDREDRFDDTEY